MKVLFFFYFQIYFTKFVLHIIDLYASFSEKLYKN